MNKKKIVFYYPDMYIGGVEMAILNLAKRIYKDYDLYFFYRTISSMELAKELAKYGIPRNISFPQADFECDVLIYCSLWYESNEFVSFIKPKRRILWCHAMIPPAGNKFYHLPFMRKMDDVVIVSKAATQTVPYGLYTDKTIKKIHTILNIVNVEEIRKKAEEKPQIDIKLARDLNISTTARLSHEKGWHRIKLLCDEFNKVPGLDWKWFIIGEGYSKNEMIRIHALLDRFPQVEFLGKQINPFPIVKQMDYVALLSDFESWGLVITEGKILKKPLIVSDFPAAHEQVEDDINGVIVPMNDYNKYKSIVYRIINNKNLYKRELDKFDFEKINEESEKEWRILLDKGRKNYNVE